MLSDSDDGPVSLPDPVLRFESALDAGELLDAVDLIPALPTDRGKSAAVVLDAALALDDLKSADAVVRRFIDRGFVPRGIGVYIADVFEQRGAPGVQAFISSLRSSSVDLNGRVASWIVSGLADRDIDEMVAALGHDQFYTDLGDAVARSLVKSGRVDAARGVVNKMRDAGTDPAIDTLRAVINAMVRQNSHTEAVDWIVHLAESGVSQIPAGTLIGELVALRQVDDAERVLTALLAGKRELQPYHVVPLLKFYQRTANRPAEERIRELAQSAGLQLDRTVVIDRSQAEPHGLEAALRAHLQQQSSPAENAYGKVINAWGRAGDPDRAEEIFHLLLEEFDRPTAASYGSILGAWRRARRPDRVQRWFDDMRQRGVTPNERHVSVLLHAYRESGDPVRAEELGEELRRDGLDVSDRSPLHTYIEGMLRRGERPDVGAFTDLVVGYASHEQLERAESALEWAMGQGIVPEAPLWDALFEGWSRAGRLTEMRSVLDRKAEHGHAPTDDQLRVMTDAHQRVGQSTTIEELRIELGDLKPLDRELRAQLAELVESDNVTPAAIRSALPNVVLLGDPQLAARFMERAAGISATLDVVSVRRLLTVARKARDADSAARVFDLFEAVGVEASEIDFNEVLRALADAGRAQDAKAIYDRLQVVAQPNAFHLQSLLRAHQEAGLHQDVIGIFDQAEAAGIDRTRHHFGSAINAAAAVGDGDRAVALVDEMVAVGLTPSPIDIDVALSAFRHDRADELQDLVERLSGEGCQIDARHIRRVMSAWRQSGELKGVQDVFDSLAVHGLRTNAYHYAELVGAHLEADRCDETVPLLQRAFDSGSSNASLLSNYVSGAVRAGRIDLAEWAIEEARSLEIRPGAASLATLALERRQQGLELTSNELMASLGAVARTSEPNEIRYLARTLARSGAVDELVALRNSELSDELSLEIAGQQVVAHAVARDGVKAELLYNEIAPSASELDPRTLQAIVGALCQVNRPHVARDAFEQLAEHGPPAGRTFGAVMDALTPVASPADIEALLRRAEAATPLTRREHGVLFNLALRAYARAQHHDDVLRLRDEMVERSLPIDRFTLGPLQRVLDEQQILGADDRRLRSAQSGVWDELGVLLDDVIHELTGPATRIGGVAKRLRVHASAGSDDELATLVQRLIWASDALLDRLGEYAVLAHADGEDALFDVRDVLRWVVARTERQASAASVEVNLSAAAPRRAEESFLVQGQAAFFRIAVRALVANSVEALADSSVPRGSRTIWLSTMHTSAPPSAGWIDVYVRDNGPGIPSEVRSRVFERGFTTKDSRGLGLGLSLVESVVNLFGGSVTLSDNTSGAEFFLRFPAALPDGDEGLK